MEYSSPTQSSDCRQDIVACIDRRRKSRVAWLMIALLFLVVGFVLIMIEGKPDDSEDDKASRRKKMGTVGTFGAVFLMLANIVWFILLLSIIIDRSPIDLALAISPTMTKSRSASRLK